MAATSDSITDAALRGGLTYYYRIRSVSGNVRSAYSEERSVQTLGAVATPTGVTAALDKGLVMTAKWSAVAGASYYEVYRADSSVRPTAQTTVCPGATLRYGCYQRAQSNSYAEALSAGKAYLIAVRAVREDKDLAGKVYSTVRSDWSAIAVVTTIKVALPAKNDSTAYKIELALEKFQEIGAPQATSFFSGQKIKITRMDKLPFATPATVVFRERDRAKGTVLRETSEPVVTRRGNSFFVVPPGTLRTGYYTVDFLVGSDTVSLPLEMQGLTVKEKAAPAKKQKAAPVTGISTKRLGCDYYCYYEFVSGANPLNENEMFVVGGGGNDTLLHTTDAWNTVEKLSINTLSNKSANNWRGDPVLSFSADGKMKLAGLAMSGDVVTGALYEQKETSFSSGLSQKILVAVPEDLPKTEWLIFDYPRITIDNSPKSPYFGSTYVSVNGLHSKVAPYSVLGSGMVRYSPPSITESVFSAQVVESMLVDPNGVLYAAGPGGLVGVPVVSRSTDGGKTFIDYPVTSARRIVWGPARVSSVSPRGWSVHRGPVLQMNKTTGRIFVTWANAKKEVVDSTFQAKRYAQDFDIYLSYSDDQAKTWSWPVTVNDDTGGGDQLFPSMAVDKDGIVYVAFVDHRDGQDLSQFDVYLAVSKDGGKTFSKNLKINDDRVPHLYGGRQIGDYLEMLTVGKDKVFVTHHCASETPDRDIDLCVATVQKSFLNTLPTVAQPTASLVLTADPATSVAHGSTTIALRAFIPAETQRACANTEWDFGDGTVLRASPSCPADKMRFENNQPVFISGNPVVASDRLLLESHIYAPREEPYTVTFQIGTSTATTSVVLTLSGKGKTSPPEVSKDVTLTIVPDSKVSELQAKVNATADNYFNNRDLNYKNNDLARVPFVFELPRGTLTLSIPSNSFTVDGTIKATLFKDAEAVKLTQVRTGLPGDYVSVGNMLVKLEAAAKGGSRQALTLTKDVLLSIAFKEQNVASKWDRDELKVYRLVGQAWTEIPKVEFVIKEVNERTKTTSYTVRVKGKDLNLGVVGLFGKLPPPPPKAEASIASAFASELICVIKELFGGSCR